MKNIIFKSSLLLSCILTLGACNPANNAKPIEVPEAVKILNNYLESVDYKDSYEFSYAWKEVSTINIKLDDDKYGTSTNVTDYQIIQDKTSLKTHTLSTSKIDNKSKRVVKDEFKSFDKEESEFTFIYDNIHKIQNKSYETPSFKTNYKYVSKKMILEAINLVENSQGEITHTYNEEEDYMCIKSSIKSNDKIVDEVCYEFIDGYINKFKTITVSEEQDYQHGNKTEMTFNLSKQKITLPKIDNKWQIIE